MSIQWKRYWVAVIGSKLFSAMNRCDVAPCTKCKELRSPARRTGTEKTNTLYQQRATNLWDIQTHKFCRFLCMVSNLSATETGLHLHFIYCLTKPELWELMKMLFAWWCLDWSTHVNSRIYRIPWVAEFTETMQMYQLVQRMFRNWHNKSVALFLTDKRLQPYLCFW